jgi:predicted nucleic acid-binding protein
MLLLDTSFLVELEDELVKRRPAAAMAVLAANRRRATAMSIITLGEFAGGFTDPQAFGEFISRFRVLQLSRAIAWHAAMMQASLPRRLGENDAWIAATALAYGATLVARESAFARVPKLNHLVF